MAVKALMTDETGKQIVDAIREKAGLEARVSDLEKNKVDKSSIAQTTGSAEDKVMSQRAVTEELGKKFDKSNVVQTTGDAEDKVMSQAAATAEFTKLSEEIADVEAMFTHGKNYFDIDSAAIGYSVRSDNGELSQVETAGASDYIEVEPDSVYSINSRHTLAFYDENKLFISGIGSADKTATVTTPPNCKYVRFSFLLTSVEYTSNVIQMEKGDKVTSIESYYVVPQRAKIKNESLDIFECGKNLFNKDGYNRKNYAVESFNGEIRYLAGYSVSDYIEVDPNTEYIASHRHTMAFYDADYVYISGIPAVDEDKTFVTPHNCKYLRISVLTEDVDVLQIERGNILTEYEPYDGQAHIKKEYVPNGYIDEDYIEDANADLMLDRNLLTDKITIQSECTVRADDGSLFDVAGSDVCATKDYIIIEPNTKYRFRTRYSLAWYDSSKTFISGIASSDTSMIVTSPANARYIRFSWFASKGENQFNRGTELIPLGESKIKEEYLPQKYTCEITNVRNTGNVTEDGNNLCLVAIKQIYTNGNTPDVTGYLYLDIYTNKLYYSATLPDNPVYLCDWDTDVAYQACGNSEESKPKYWHFSVTKDGDIICLHNYHRSKPIVYPHGDFGNPVCVDGLTTNPYGLLTNQSIVQTDDGTFYFGEYAVHSLDNELNNDRRNIWKVTKPYTDSDSWSIEHSFKHVYYQSAISNEPDNEIGHIHSVTFDFYSNSLYANTGDIGRHVRIWRKKLPNGTWSEVACGIGDNQATEDSQKYRVVNLLFTETSCWWATDSFNALHNLYKADRDTNGDIDFSTTQKIMNLEMFAGRSTENQQPTYANILLREPNGILFIDRAEPRTDHKLDIVFYDLGSGTASICKTLKKVDSSNGLYGIGDVDRLGLPNQCTVTYQPFGTDYIMVGGADNIRLNQVDLFNNAPSNYIGALKIKVMKT